MQLIILVETKSKDGSDCIYLRSFFKKFYNGLRGTKLSFVTMNGKTNYFKKENEISKLIEEYSGVSKVIVAIDVDKPELLEDQEVLNKNIEQYCIYKNYELVWFNKTIEQVFIKEIIKKKKDEAAKNFLRKQLINKVDINCFNKENTSKCKQGESNLKRIIDKLLAQK